MVTTSMRHVSVVCVLYNSAAVIAECVASLPRDVEVILVDNASADDGISRAQQVRPDAIVVRSPRNLGFGGGCNLGWVRAAGTYVAFVNPDVRMRPGALAVMVHRLLTEPHGIIGPALFDATGALRPCSRRPSLLADCVHLLPASTRWAPGLGLSSKLDALDRVHCDGGEVWHVEGACFVVRRADLEAIHGFDEDLFLYGEEESLAIRLGRLGGRAVYEPTAEADHIGAESTRRIGGAATRHYYRSRVLMYRKRDGDTQGRLAGALLAFAALIALPTAALNSVLRRSRTYRLGYLWDLLRGVAAGVLSVQRSAHRY
jgi:N-acetylglucosaminyl-diphospho-decaprenol L-rhamnosyltransferase